MKKIVLTIICLLCVALCLVGCADYSADVIKINKLLNSPDYAKVELEVFVNDNELVSWFEVTENDDGSSTVVFKVQRYATFPEEDDGTLPDSFIETFEGSATIRNGQVTDVSGDVPQDVQLQNVLGGMQFSPNYLSDIKVNGRILSAKVSKPQKFMGQADFDCKANSMTVSVKYYKLINHIRINYVTSGGDKVEFKYTYTPSPSVL